MKVRALATTARNTEKGGAEYGYVHFDGFYLAYWVAVCMRSSSTIRRLKVAQNGSVVGTDNHLAVVSRPWGLTWTVEI